MSEKLITNLLAPAITDRPIRFWHVFWIGLSMMVGSGVFVVIGMMADMARSQLGLALVLAACLSLCNGLNSIPLATAPRLLPPLPDPKPTAPESYLKHPDPQEIYAYSDHRLNPWLGFTAALGLTLAEATAAATAALGLAGYLIRGLGWNSPIALLPIALLSLLVITGIALQGVRFSYFIQGVRLWVTIGSLLCLIVAGAYALHITPIPPAAEFPVSIERTGWRAIPTLLHTTSLLMVAYAGYGKIAQYGRTAHVDRPRSRRLFTRRILTQVVFGLMGFTLLLYGGVVFTAGRLIGAATLQNAVEVFVAPLLEVANLLPMPAIPQIVASGAVVTLAAILYALLSHLGCIFWLMGQRRDLPVTLAKLSSARNVPNLAIAVASGMIGVLLVMVGDVMALWSFSAFAFLVHAAITNLAAIQLRPFPYPRWLAVLAGLLCLVLILGLGWRVWMVGTVWLAIGLMWRGINLWVLEQSENQD